MAGLPGKVTLVFFNLFSLDCGRRSLVDDQYKLLTRKVSYFSPLSGR